MPARLRTILGLLLLALLAVLVHGYHLGADDAAIYVPAIKRFADPALYPFGAEYFMSHANLSIFAFLVGTSARLTHLPIDLVIFLWHAGSVFLLLCASWRLLGTCVTTNRARWSGVALLAGLLSVPVAGTALAIMDPYFTARSLSTPLIILAIACYLSKRPKQAVAWLVLTAAIHPQMSVFGAVLLVSMEILPRLRLSHREIPAEVGVAMAGIPFLFELQPARGIAREVLFSRTYFFVFQWEWYEWVGVFAPLLLLAWYAWARPRGSTATAQSLARTLVFFGLAFTVFAVILNSAPRLENYTRWQPMRCFHVVYVIFFLLLGALAGEWLLRDKVWRWLALFLPLALGMWMMQRDAYSASPHVEWPGMYSANHWTRAFLWIRGHTPKDAVFALDPNYLFLHGEDQHGFRAVAERSVLADNLKDSGAVSLFPRLADAWKEQQRAQAGWPTFGKSEYEKLARQYPVTWILAADPAPAGLICPYDNGKLVVCRLGQ
jgi:hypothetical protein